MTGQQLFFDKLKHAYQAYRKHSKKFNLALHDLTVKAIYLISYLLLIIMALMGLSKAFDQEVDCFWATIAMFMTSLVGYLFGVKTA